LTRPRAENPQKCSYGKFLDAFFAGYQPRGVIFCRRRCKHRSF
jgi:hypothetical protein